MFKFLIVFFLFVLGLIYLGNYIDYKNQKITTVDYNRRIRLFFVLIFIFIGILIWFKRH
ncbi:MAG TPA: hypothetical protein VKB19_12585 [Pedobacter sp.]|nr:hypothetical protein [Pedobacter sp.]